MNLKEIREKYPEYNDLSDKQLAEGLHQKFYSDMDFHDFSKRIGYKDETKVKTEIKTSPSLSNIVQSLDIGLTPPAEMPKTPLKIPKEEPKNGKNIFKDLLIRANILKKTPTEAVSSPVFDDLGLPVGEPRVLGKALEIPFLPGRMIARAPGAMTEAEPFEIERKEASISDIGGKIGRTILQQGAATEALPLDITKKEDIGNLGEQIGRLVFEAGVEMPVASGLIRLLSGTIGSAAKLIRESTTWRRMTIPDRRLVVQSLDDIATKMKAAGFAEAQILRTIKRTAGDEAAFERFAAQQGIKIKPEVAPTGKPKTPEETIKPPEKYKTKEEYIKSQGKPLYHGTASDFKEFDITKAGTVMKSDWGKGIYLEPSKSGADYYRIQAIKALDPEYNKAYEEYENIVKALPPVSSVNSTPAYNEESRAALKRFQDVGKKIDSDKTKGRIVEVYLDPKAKIYDYTSSSGMTDPYLSERLREKGYDVIRVDKGKYLEEIVVINPEVIKTKDQLSDIWDKAHKKPSPTEAKKEPWEMTQKEFNEIQKPIYRSKGKTALGRDYIGGVHFTEKLNVAQMYDEQYGGSKGIIEFSLKPNVKIWDVGKQGFFEREFGGHGKKAITKAQEKGYVGIRKVNGEVIIFNEAKAKGLALDQSHKDYIKQALSEGKPVPPEVLKDYPELETKKEIEPKGDYDVEDVRIPKGIEVLKRAGGFDIYKGTKHIGRRPDKEEAIQYAIKYGEKEKPAKAPGKPTIKEKPIAPKEQKKFLLSEIDKAIKSAIDKVPQYVPKRPKWDKDFGKPFNAQRDIKAAEIYQKNIDEYGTVEIEVPGAGKFTIINTKHSLREFKKRASQFPISEPKAQKPRVATIKKIKPKEYWAKDNMMDLKNGWVSDGYIIIKSKPPTGKIKWRKEVPPFSMVEDMLKGDLLDAEIRYYTTTDPDMGEVVSKVPIVRLDETISYVIIKAGKKRYPFNVEKLNIITNRYPKAKLKINPEKQTLIAYDKEEPVAVLMPMRFGGQKDIPNIKWAAKEGYASTGEYATNIKSVIDLPEMVALAKELMQGKYPEIRKRLRAAGGLASGVFWPGGTGRIGLRADLFQDVPQAAATLAHEIGHLVDYLPDKTLKRGNILGHLASLKKYMKHSIPRMPGGLGELTSKDRARLRYQAEKLIKKEGAERWIDEVIRKELPITPDDVLNIWKAVVDAKAILPELYDYIAKLDTPQKKAIVKDAMKGVVRSDLQKFAKVIEKKTGKKVKIELSEQEIKDLIKEKYADLINEELKKRRLFDLETITKELKSLTHAWKPFDPAMDPKFTQYRYKPVELYADAFSALVNAPGLLKSHAPNFYEGFFNYLEKKPEVKRLYNQIQDMILNGDIDENLDKRILNGFRHGDRAYAKALDKDYRLKDGLMRDFVDIHWALIKDVKKIGEANIPAGENPRYKMEELVYSGAESEWIMGDVFNKMIQPLERAGLGWDDFGYELLLRRVAKGDRRELANVEGIHPARAEKKLAARNQRRTLAQRVAMDKAISEFKKLNNYVIDRGIDVERWGNYLVKKMQENSDYVTFDVVDYIEKRNGRWISSKIFPQIGTLKEIANTATATVMKNIAIIKTINRQIAAESVANFYLKYFPENIRPAETKWNGKFHEIKKSDDPKEGLLVYLKKGRAQGYYVDKWIADMFDVNPIESVAIAKVLKWTIQPFRMAFVELNYGFWMFNIIRDYFRASTNLPKASLLKFLPSYLKGIKPAFKSVYGIPDDVVKQMLQDKMLISIADIRGLRPEDAQIERMLKMYHMLPQTWKYKIVKPFGNFFTYFTNIGRGFERTPKVAGKLYLEKKFPNMPKEEIGRIVRNQSGSPNFLTLGRMYPIYNNILMFSNAIKEGYRGDYKAFSRSPADFMWKKAKYVYLPKLLMYAGVLGLLGAGIKVIFDGMSEYDKTNYVCVPLGLTESGKSVYLRVPMDETGRIMGGTLWKVLNRDYKKMFTGLFDYMAGQAPTLHPGLDVLVSVSEYASGKNPYDHFKGKYAIPEQIFQAGGKRSHKAFLKWLANKSGSTLVYRFRGNTVDEIKTELEKYTGYPFLSNIVGRFLKVSDQGVRENLREIKNDLRKTRAGELLDTKDVVIKILNGEQITPKELALILKNPDVVDRSVIVNLARKYGMIFIQEMITAQSEEEKAAVMKTFLERNELLKKAEK